MPIKYDTIILLDDGSGIMAVDTGGYGEFSLYDKKEIEKKLKFGGYKNQEIEK